jgi:hypothetical protein
LLDFLELETQIHEIFLKEAEIEPRPAMSWSMNETSRKNMWCAVSKVEVKDSLCDFLESVDPPTARATCEARLDEFATACATEE